MSAAVLEALIFDLDGTLADTEETHRQAFNAAFIEFELGWDWSPRRYAELLRISGGRERIAHYIDSLGLPLPERARVLELLPALHRTKTRIYHELLERGQRPFRPGVAKLLRAAREAGLQLAIASTTTSSNVEALLHANLSNEPHVYFNVIACADQVPEKKPSPAIYQLVLASLRLPASACVAFEDSVNGLRAAKGAGLSTVVTPTRWNAGQDFSAADLVLGSLEEIDVARIERLLGEAHAAA